MKQLYNQPEQNMGVRLVAAIVLVICLAGTAIAGTTGKISGRVIDAQTREGLPGASVMLEGTFLGAAADFDGYYYINNIPPGKYNLVVSLVGYQKTVVKGIVVNIDLTSKQDVKLASSAVEADEVVITAERPLVQKDLTSTSVTISSDDIKAIPVENIGQVINLQAGVVGGHFRGGRSNEVGYLVDGVSVTDPFNGSMSLQVENSSVREMEVISGAFNAEYGQAMSGIVNIVTQDGSTTTHGGVSFYISDYFSGHSDLFPNLGTLDHMRTRNFQGTLSGPTGIDKLSYFATGRYLHDNGFLYGKRVFNIIDGKTNSIRNSILIHTGDSTYVPMNPAERYSLNGKLTYGLPELKITYAVFFDKGWNKYFDHAFAWTPDAIMTHYHENIMHSVQLTHVPSQSTYQSLKFSSNTYSYKGYLYEDPFDTRYVAPYMGAPGSSAFTFNVGGNQSSRYDRSSRTYLLQWSLASQVSKKHKIGVGAEADWYRIANHGTDMVNKTEGLIDSTTGLPVFTLGYPTLGYLGNQFYTKLPFAFSAYVQDKMEYDIMIINAGLRFDYFNPRSQYIADLQNPHRNPLFPGAGLMTNASAKMQVSPRLGISFPITDQGIIHFSYGHFFQIPSFENMYRNWEALVGSSSNVSDIVGNPDLKAQQTVKYEVGLQQVLFTNISVDFTVYYSDIRNLLGMELIKSYDGITYARFTNRDYGNVRGFILSVDKRLMNFFGFKADYTYQIAEGNASDPFAVFYNNQSNPPVESNKYTVPLNWDQRSTLNMTVTVGEPSNWTVGLIMNYGTGFPYTESERLASGLRFENGGWKPSTFNVDLRAEKTFRWVGLNFNAFILVYNLLDIKNEYNVDPSSGRANVNIFAYQQAGEVKGLNTMQEYLNDPTAFSAPRQVQLGLNVEF